MALFRHKNVGNKHGQNISENSENKLTSRQLTDMSGLYHYHLSAKFACLQIFSLYFSDITSKIQRPTLSLIISCRDGIQSGGYKSICVVVS
jgi:hypothetical protein